MATYREIAYMCLEELKMFTDDSDYTIDHVLFLADKYRVVLLDRRYREIKKHESPLTNYQELCLNLKEVPAIPGTTCAGVYLRTDIKVPVMLSVGEKYIYPIDYFNSERISYVPLERMPFVGENKWLKSMIYVTMGPDNYLYLKSANPQFLYLRKLKVKAMFMYPQEVMNLECGYCKEEGNCDILDKPFPLEETLITTLIQMIVQELSGQRYMPTDITNDGRDNMANVNMKVANKND